MNDALRQRWEPNVAPVSERLALLKAAHEQGVYTCVSLEPVLDPDAPLAGHPAMKDLLQPDARTIIIPVVREVRAVAGRMIGDRGYAKGMRF